MYTNFYYFGTTNNINKKIGHKKVLKVPCSKDDLLKIYQPTGYYEFGISISKIEYYYQTATELQTAIKLILLNADLSNNLEEEELFKKILLDTYRDISYIKMLISEQNFYKENLDKFKNWLETCPFEMGDSNAFNPYVALHRLIDNFDKFFHEFLGDEKYNEIFTLTYKH